MNAYEELVRRESKFDDAEWSMTMDGLKRRFGRFEIDNEDLDNFEGRAKLARIFSRCIITRAEQLYHKHCIEYFAMSEAFTRLGTGDMIPTYVWEEIEVDGNIIAVAKRQK